MSKAIGYMRVSATDQNTNRQLEGITLDKVFEDKITGSVKDRPALTLCLDYMRDGDILYIHSIDRLARNVDHLKQLIEHITNLGVEVRFVKQNLVFSKGVDNPINKLMLHVLGAIAEFERDLIRERQREGIAAAKKAGKHLGRPETDSTILDEITRLLADKISILQISKILKISRPTIYKLINSKVTY